jgi:apolipoprotein N-acyltransferase
LSGRSGNRRKGPRQPAARAGKIPDRPSPILPRCSIFSILPYILSAVSALLFALSFPNRLARDGWGYLAFIAPCPLIAGLSLLPRLSRKSASSAAACGFIYGALGYGLLCSWVFGYHPVAPFALLAVKGASCALIAIGISILMGRFKRFGWLFSACLWTAGEFVSASGFLAFPYGLLGYSQFMDTPLIQSASLWGVYGISFILSACASFLALPLSRALGGRNRGPQVLKLAIPGSLLALAVLALHGFGLFSLSRPALRSESRLSVLVLQAQTSPRKEGPKPPAAYAAILESMISAQTTESLSSLDLIVTPETVYPYPLEPALALNTDTPESQTAREIAALFSKTGKPCLFGNASQGLGASPGGGPSILTFNSVLYLEDGQVWSSYEKRRLVPFIEYFPFERALPGAYVSLESLNRFFWTPGERPAIFRAGGVGIGTPICYEDSFGSDCADFSRLGARLIIALTSDSWAKSLPAMRQHLACAVLRAPETRLPILRASNDGISCLIDAKGRILGEMAPFERASQIFDIVIPARIRTPYSRVGDILPLLCALISIIALVMALVPPASERPCLPAPSFIDKT